MNALQTIIGTFTGELFLVWPGGYEIRLGLGSEMYDLEESSAGHLMLLCFRFSERQPNQTSESETFCAIAAYEKLRCDAFGKLICLLGPI